MTFTRVYRYFALFLLAFSPFSLAAQESPGPLKIEITEGVIEPVPVALAPFLSQGAEAEKIASDVLSVIESDLEGSGLFRAISERAFISRITSFDSPVQYADWKAINAQGLLTGEVELAGDQLTVRFRLFDIFAEAPLGEGLQLSGTADGWRRIAHQVADAVYSRITGEGGYFDSRVVFVSESGGKADRRKRLAVMDYDGANLSYLTDSADLVLAPRISDAGDQVLYTSYESGIPRINVIDTKTLKRRALNTQEGAMSFSPRFAPDGKSVLFSLSVGGNTDLYTMDLPSGAPQRLTSASSIETSPSYAPDGTRIVFESDRSGNQQLYVMPAEGGDAQRISFGSGRYGTPVWSPRGDFIAFTKQSRDRFHIGVMRPDGSEERLLTASFLDESPSWSPNGRVLMFMRETPGVAGNSALFSVDIRGRNLRKVPTPGPASDPAWSPLLP